MPLQRKAKKVRNQNQRRKALNLQGIQRKKELSPAINLKEEVKRPFAKSLEWIIILKTSNQSLLNSVKSSVVVVHKLLMKFMENASQYKVMLSMIYGTS